jgi:hypothetical protein
LEISGFRLRDLGHWETGFAQNIFDALGPLSGICNAECVFCMERGLPFERDRSVLSLSEAGARLKHYSPELQRCLFPSARPHMEPFINKESVAILERARQKIPEDLFIITTNGTTLTEDIVKELARIKPVLVKLSINSTDVGIRKSLMGIKGKKKSIAESMSLFRKCDIPFIGSIVAWPSISNDDMGACVREIAAFSPYGIRIRMPLLHKYSPVQPQENLDHYWRKTAEFVNSIKAETDVPCWIEPVQYTRVPIMPLLDGVIKNSPAMGAGILPGDMIVSINNIAVSSRSKIRELFASDEFDGMDLITVEIERGDQRLVFMLDSFAACGSTYPYNPNLRYPGEKFGMLLLPDFDVNFIDNILNHAIRHNATKILLFASPLTAGTVEGFISKVSPYKEFFEERDLWIYSLEDTWMEGNTAMLDSRFVDDYEKAVYKICRQLKSKPDLILIPDCFGSSWGIDFTGRSAFEIERTTDVPVELIPWHYIYGRED